MTGAGCVVEEPAPPIAEPVVVESGPIVEAPGVVIVQEEPPIEERVYVYDPGYPPGTYFYNGGYYYGGYYYPHDVYVDRVVQVNIVQNRYTNIEQNRSESRVINNRGVDRYNRSDEDLRHSEMNPGNRYGQDGRAHQPGQGQRLQPPGKGGDGRRQ